MKFLGVRPRGGVKGKNWFKGKTRANNKMGRVRGKKAGA